jgi:hypothetical protein
LYWYTSVGMEGMNVCGSQSSSSFMNPAFSAMVLPITAPPGFSRNRAVSAYFSHTSRVMNGGSITAMSNVPLSASALAKSTGALKSYRTNPRSLFHCSSRSKHHDRARTSLLSEKYTLGVLRKHALVSVDAHTVSTSRTMASMLRLLYQY